MDGGSLEGLPVVLLAKREIGIPDEYNKFDIWIPRNGESELKSRYFVLTTESGVFELLVRSSYPLDSISVAVLLQGEQTITGDTLVVDELEVTECSYNVQVDDGGCFENSITKPVTYKLRYRVPDQTVIVP